MRSRDPAVLATCSLVVDVGGEYDPARLRFDHHQKTFSESINSLDASKKWKTKLSSAGLVYFHFGREIISTLLESTSQQLTEKVFDKVYENFIQEIDAIDNGISTHDGEGEENKFITNCNLYRCRTLFYQHQPQLQSLPSLT